MQKSRLTSILIINIEYVASGVFLHQSSSPAKWQICFKMWSRSFHLMPMDENLTQLNVLNILISQVSTSIKSGSHACHQHIPSVSSISYALFQLELECGCKTESRICLGKIKKVW